MTTRLFSPVRIGPLTLPNRIVLPPMCQYSAKDGLATDWHLIHYGSLALSGVGLLIVEATGVLPEGRISPDCLGLWNNDCATALARMVKSIRTYANTPLSIQLNHAGRKASTGSYWVNGCAPVPPSDGGWDVVSASAIPYNDKSPTPKALDEVGLRNVIAAFASSAKRATDIGFDAVEIHGAHGYLLHQFLSPLTNKRTDSYGGSLENRMRLTLEVYDAMKAVLPADKAIGVRLSATDWLEGGWTVEDTVTLVKALGDRGCAYAHISSAGLTPDLTVRPEPGYQVALAERIKKETGVPTIAVGLILDAKQAESILEADQADMVAVGRAMIFNPRWPWQAARDLKVSGVPAAPQEMAGRPFEAPMDFFSFLAPGQH